MQEIFDFNFIQLRSSRFSLLSADKLNSLHRFVFDRVEDSVCDFQYLDNNRDFTKLSICDINPIGGYCLQDRLVNKFGFTPSGIDENCDVIVSVFNLHKVNNIDSFIKNNIVKKLNKSGIFIGNFFGINNLYQLGTSAIKTQSELLKEIHPMVLPCIEAKTAGMIMYGAGFRSVSVCCYKFTVRFGSFVEMLNFLRQMGEANCLKNRNKAMTGKFFMIELEKQFLSLYKEFALTFEVVFLLCLI